MRVLLVNATFYPGNGSATHMFNLASLLQRHGHEVAFFSMEDARNLPDPNADLFVSNIDFRQINSNRSLAVGLKVMARVIYSTEARRKFAACLDRVKPDLVHLHNIHGHITPSVIFEAKRRGLPVVWTLHDNKLICPNTHFLIDETHAICEACGIRSYYQCALKRCKKGSFLASLMATIEAYCHRAMRVRERVDAFISPSRFLRSKCVERGFDPDKITVIPGFVSDSVFRSPSESQGYFLFLGRLEQIKGVPQLIDACRMAPEVHVKLAGRVAEDLADSIPSQLPPNAEYVGMKSGEELIDLVSGALAIVVPSILYENQPYSILEAFACAKPVIACNLGGMAELVEHKVRGLLVELGNTEDLVEAMKWMSSHPEDAKRMGIQAQEYARELLNSEDQYRMLMGVYDKVAK